MGKIFKSLAIMLAIGSIAIGATWSYFSDEEKSVGNTFTAGSLDLKVDHKKMVYNGKECEENCTENTGTNLIDNGSFENPDVTNSAKWQIFSNSDPNLKWTVEWVGSQTTFSGRTRPEPALAEYHEGVLGSAQHGDQYTELDSDWFGPNDSLSGEPALVKIHQDITTTPGKKYKLHYYFSPRPNTGSTENTMYVNIDGSTVTTHGPVAGGGSIVWLEYTKEFTATGNTTKIEFAGGGSDNSLGIFLDNVSVHPYDCTYQLDGETCKLWEEKDLATGDIFWNFSDIKPGDQGVNVISLHPFDNNAWVCMRTANENDLENNNIDPEKEAGDTDTPQGELSPFLKVFTWWDTDGDGIFDIGETAIDTTDFGALGTLALADSNHDPALTGGQTKYLGLYWCAGTLTPPVAGSPFICDLAGMDNTAQTDIYTTDIEFYAEQERNNDSFDCSNWK